MGNSIAINKGFTVIELVIVVAIIGILLVAVISNGMNYINRARFQSTVREMGSIAQAAIDYYNSSNNPNDATNPQPLTWPASNASGLGGPYMPQAVTSNPFGNSYQITGGNNMVTVSTVIPNGVLIDPNEGSFLSVKPVAGGQQISITQSVPNEFTGRLTYDIQYLDKN